MCAFVCLCVCFFVGVVGVNLLLLWLLCLLFRFAGLDVSEWASRGLVDLFLLLLCKGCSFVCVCVVFVFVMCRLCMCVFLFCVIVLFCVFVVVVVYCCACDGCVLFCFVCWCCVCMFCLCLCVFDLLFCFVCSCVLFCIVCLGVRGLLRFVCALCARGFVSVCA